jgi:peptide/nickel transport system ATP-binding protein
MLEIKNFSLKFNRYEKSFFKRTGLEIISHFDLSVKRGEIVAVIGSSGAGKSLLAHALLGILPHNAETSGSIIYKDEVLTEKRKKKLRGRDIVLIPQSVGFLNPLNTSGNQVLRSAFLSSGDKKKAANLRESAFRSYNLSREVYDLYPHEVSGGMARRILTAMATVSEADLIIADEPTTGLDNDAKKDSMLILRKLADEGKGVVLITHDVNSALEFADKIAVFYAGTTVEFAPVSNFKNPSMLNHPYSRALIEALPQNGFKFISGSHPGSGSGMKGCRFEPRCTEKSGHCGLKYPEKIEYENGFVRCNNAAV